LLKFKYKKMKYKLTLLFVVIMCTTINLTAQEMVKGTNFLSLGVGPSNNYYGFYSGGTPAVRFAFDHGFREAGPGVITLGGAVGFFTKFYKGVTSHQYQTYYYTEHRTYLSATFRVGYYYNFGKLIKAPQLNAYAGIGTGVLQCFYSYTGAYNPNSIDNGGALLLLNIYFGANYFLSKKFALFTEFGYDISYVTLGMTFNL